jgi:LmbE family N-acetylglucosaminyl deacetylase
MRHYLQRLYKHLMFRSTSEASQDDLARSAIVLAPHQDDETLGCGGTMIRKREAGAEVRVIFMTDGTLSHSRLMSPGKLKAIREKEAVAACQALGLAESDVFFLEFQDGRLHEGHEMAVGRVLELLGSHRPDEIFVPYHGELLSDHAATYRIAMSALARWGKPVTLYEYPVWAWYHWPWVDVLQNSRRETRDVVKNTLVSGAGLRLLKDLGHAVYIGDVLDRKRAALDQYRSQMTRLIPDRRWLTLGDLANGAFLSQLLGEYEYFRRCEPVKDHGASASGKRSAH